MTTDDPTVLDDVDLLDAFAAATEGTNEYDELHTEMVNRDLVKLADDGDL